MKKGNVFAGIGAILFLLLIVFVVSFIGSLYYGNTPTAPTVNEMVKNQNINGLTNLLNQSITDNNSDDRTTIVMGMDKVVGHEKTIEISYSLIKNVTVANIFANDGGELSEAAQRWADQNNYTITTRPKY